SQRLAVVIPNAALRADGGHSRDARTFRISVEWLAAQSERGQAVDVDEKELKCSTPMARRPVPSNRRKKKGRQPALPLPRTGSSNPLPSSGESCELSVPRRLCR